MATDGAPLITALLPYIIAMILGHLLSRFLCGEYKPRYSIDESSKDKEDDEDLSEPHPSNVEDGGVRHIPLHIQTYSDEEMIRRSREFYIEVNKRRSCRFFSNKGVSQEVLENIILAAGKTT